MIKGSCQVQERLTRLFAVTISALRISGSYLLLDEDLEFTVGKIKVQRRYLISKHLAWLWNFLAIYYSHKMGYKSTYVIITELRFKPA